MQYSQQISLRVPTRLKFKEPWRDRSSRERAGFFCRWCSGLVISLSLFDSSFLYNRDLRFGLVDRLALQGEMRCVHTLLLRLLLIYFPFFAAHCTSREDVARVLRVSSHGFRTTSSLVRCISDILYSCLCMSIQLVYFTIVDQKLKCCWPIKVQHLSLEQKKIIKEFTPSKTMIISYLNIAWFIRFMCAIEKHLFWSQKTFHFTF